MGRATRLEFLAHGAIAVLITATVITAVAAGVPHSALLQNLGTVLAAWMVGTVALRIGSGWPHAASPAQAVCLGLAIAGAATVVVALVQVFWPALAAPPLFAPSPGGGRAYGNLRQPNQMGTLLLWALVAAVALWECRHARSRDAPAASKETPAPGQPPRPPRAGSARDVLLPIPAALWVLIAAWTLGMLALVLSGSRTAALGTGVLCLWGLLDRQLSPASRWLMAAAPAGYAAAWWGMRLWAGHAGQAFGAERLVTQTENISSSRLDIWSNAIDLIAAHPWTGVGWGNFNFAWTLTPLPQRPGEFFDHPHNLVLHLAAELGIPLATIIVFLLAWALWAAWQRACRVGQRGVTGRAFVVMLLLVGLHSLLEYPLWYAYFLLPSAFMLGYTLGLVPQTVQAGAKAARPRRRSLPAWWGALCVIGAGIAAVEYREVTAIFHPAANAPPLAQRIAQGQNSLFFAHHAHYAAATTAPEPTQALPSFALAAGNLLDARLMMAWSTALAAAGDEDRARHLAQRLREFHREESRAFFSPCPPSADRPTTTQAHEAAGPAAQALPFQCLSPTKPMGWRDYRP